MRIIYLFGVESVKVVVVDIVVRDFDIDVGFFLRFGFKFVLLYFVFG